MALSITRNRQQNRPLLPQVRQVVPLDVAHVQFVRIVIVPGDSGFDFVGFVGAVVEKGVETGGQKRVDVAEDGEVVPGAGD